MSKMFWQLLLVTLVGVALALPSHDKISPNLNTILASQGHANVVVSFTEGNEVVLRRINAMKFSSRTVKITTMKAQLEELQASSQKNALRILSTHNVTFHSLWINNRIYAQGVTSDVMAAIADLPEVSEIREEYIISMFEPIESDGEPRIKAEWGIDKIEAEQAWSLRGGNNGTGVVVATLDTGARYSHEALRDSFRAEYGWYNPYRKDSLPSDSNGHGTHVMGTIVGSGGIGVAPGAQWIMCAAAFGLTPPEMAFNQCGQWITCPTLPDGESSPDCSKAPHVVSNSWGGGQGQTWFDPVINVWRSADIIPVFIIGNAGPTCGSANSPGDNPNVIAVGSTREDDMISPFSSRGPARSGIVKPDVSAPGSEIRSAWRNNDSSYNTISGTSMAAPHVAGTIALLLSHNRNLSFDQVKDLLQDNTDRNLGSEQTCGNIPPDKIPNNIYGYGRINARKSLAAAINGFNSS